MSPALHTLHERIISAIRESTPVPVMKISLASPTTAKLDLSLSNPLVASTDCKDNKDVTRLLHDVLAQSGATYGIGGYAEKRGWYAR